MQLNQIFTLVNEVTQEALGETGVIQEDLSNVVDVGTKLFQTDNWFDKFTGRLIDKVGRVIFVNRDYKGVAPRVMRDGWEYGSIMQKIRSDLPVAKENKSWVGGNGDSIDQFQITVPNVHAKLYNTKEAYQFDRTIREHQLKSAFQSADQLNAFMAMLANDVTKAQTIALDELVMRTINSFTIDTMYDAFGDVSPVGKSTVRAVNLLYKYKTEIDSTMTKEKALSSPEFIRYAAFQIKLTMNRLKRVSKLFNIGGTTKFTPDDQLHVIMLNEFMAAADIYLQSDTYHEAYTALPNAETVPYWQGTGVGYDRDSTWRINATSGSGHSLEVDGIIGVMFDHEALGVLNPQSRTTSVYNANGEYTNFFYKNEVQFFNDLDENFIVFFIA